MTDRTYDFLLMFNSNNRSISFTVFDISDIEKCCNLEIQVRGHSRLSNLVPFDSLPSAYGFLLMSNSNFVSKMHSFKIFAMLLVIEVIGNNTIR